MLSPVCVSLNILANGPLHLQDVKVGMTNASPRDLFVCL